MPRRARIEFLSLRSSLVNLPISVYGPLVEHHVRPQNLAVHLLLVSRDGKDVGGEERQSAYVGWTGMASSSSLARFKGGSSSSDSLETVEIDPQFGSGLGLRVRDIIEIGLLQDLAIASSVVTEPFSSDDWEIIETHAEYMEQNLLSQVRVASVNQEIDVWVFGRTRARLRVVSFEPKSTKHGVILLGTDTEVSIAPKKRQMKQEKTDVLKADDDAAVGTKTKIIDKRVLRALPHSLVTCPAIPENANPFALVSIGTYMTLCGKWPPYEFTDGFGPVNILRYKRPINPLSPETTDGVRDTEVEPAARVIHSAANSSQKEAGAETQDNASAKLEAVTIRWSRELSDDQVLLFNVDLVKEWEPCLFYSTSEARKMTCKEIYSDVKRIAATDTKLHDLAGIDAFLEDCTHDLTAILFSHHAFKRPVRNVQGALVTGRSGAGKTSVARALAKTLEASWLAAHTIYVDFAEHQEKRVPRLKAFFEYLVKAAVWYRPTVLIIDNIDALLEAEKEHENSIRTRQLTELFLLRFMHQDIELKDIVLIATAQSESSLHPRLISSHLFNFKFKLKPPARDTRRDILAHDVNRRVAKSERLSVDPENPINFAYLATETEGYLPSDLIDLGMRAVHESLSRSRRDHSDKAIISTEDFQKAKVDFVPISLRDVKLEKSDISWSDIGGLKKAKEVIRETLEWPTRYAAIFAKCPLRLRSGILLYGYPGCGKTMLASAIAKECGLNFITVKGPELLNKYIGASEKSVRDLFDRASAAKPCVLFFDEFDSIAPKRGHDSTGVTDRVVNQMLTQLDGVEGLDGVYVLAATSRPDLIDSALLRPGRLDKSLLCDMPNFEDRKEILQVVSKKISLAPGIDWDVLAKATDGFSGADLQALVYNAHLEALTTSLDARNNPVDPKGKGKAKEGVPLSADEAGGEDAIEYYIVGGPDDGVPPSKAEENAMQQKLRTMLENVERLRGGQGKREEKVKDEKVEHPLTHADLMRSLASSRPSLPIDERLRFQRIFQGFLSDRSGEMPLPPDGRDVGTRVSLM